jgi:hypothetical protein
VSVFEIVKRAVEVSDPGGADRRLGQLLAQFEDDDEAAATAFDLERRLATAVEGIDVEIDDPAVSVATAVILYLARRHDEPNKILRLAARAEWKGDPPQSVREWLADRGVEA